MTVAKVNGMRYLQTWCMKKSNSIYSSRITLVDGEKFRVKMFCASHFPLNRSICGTDLLGGKAVP